MKKYSQLVKQSWPEAGFGNTSARIFSAVDLSGALPGVLLEVRAKHEAVLGGLPRLLARLYKIGHTATLR